MAFLDKLTSVAKDVAEKGTALAKDAVDKGQDAIEIGKLNAKVSAETKAANEAILQIGEFFLAQINAGTITVPAELEAVVETVKEHLANAEAVKAEIEAKKAEKTAAKAE